MRIFPRLGQEMGGILAFGRPDGIVWKRFWAKMGRLCYASCFMLIWFNGQCLMREGLRICGLANLSPQILMSSFRAYTTLHLHAYTVHESCFDVIMHCTNIECLKALSLH